MDEGAIEDDLDLDEGSDDGDVEEFITGPPSAQTSSGIFIEKNFTVLYFNKIPYLYKGLASTPPSTNSSPPVLGEEPSSPKAPHINLPVLSFGGKPPNHAKRGPGRPRKEFSGRKERPRSIRRYTILQCITYTYID